MRSARPNSAFRLPPGGDPFTRNERKAPDQETFVSVRRETQRTARAVMIFGFPGRLPGSVSAPCFVRKAERSTGGRRACRESGRNLLAPPSPVKGVDEAKPQEKSRCSSRCAAPSESCGFMAKVMQSFRFRKWGRRSRTPEIDANGKQYDVARPSTRRYERHDSADTGLDSRHRSESKVKRREDS